MTAATITIGTVATLISAVCWLSFVTGVGRMVRVIFLGQPDRTRNGPFVPRLANMIKEFAAHTRMIKIPTVGVAHWLVMVGFLLGFILFFEAYGQTFNADFHWPIFGDWKIYHLMDEVLGIGTVVGIVALIIIRQLNHPRIPERLSRFSGSKFGPAYTIEGIVLVEGLGMIFVKAGKIATFHHSNPYTDFFTREVAHILPSSELMVSLFAVVKLLSGSLFLFLVGRNLTWGVAWHRFAAFFNIYFKRAPVNHVALGAAVPMMSGGKVLDMDTADPDVDAFGAGKLEDFTWKGWLDFTTCTECGRCQSQCPAWNTGKPLSPKLLIMSLRDHGYAKAPYLLAGGRKDVGGDEVGLVDADGAPLTDKLDAIEAAARAEAERPLVGESHGTTGAVIDTETLWSCTTCGACVEQCPVDIEHVDHIINMRRYQVLIESDFPHELAGMFKKLETKGNPWGQNAAERTAWIDEIDIDIPVFGEDTESFEGFEYLFWVGCAGAYEDRAKKTTKAVAELLDIAAVDFLVLGQGETCTGDSARRAGNEFLFQMLAQQNIETLKGLFDTAPQQKRKIVVTCAHCFNTLANEYPQVGGDYEVVHHTQLLNRLVRDNRLVPVAPTQGSITYHDPCYLGRHNRIYTAPRALIGAAGPEEFTEMPRHGERSMCCGAGGSRMWMEETIGKRINVDRVDEALGTDAKTIATGCPFCRVMLTDGVTAQTAGTELEDQVQVVDVAQLLLDGVKRNGVTVERGGRFLGTPIPGAKPAEPAEVSAPAAPAAKAEKPAATASAPAEPKAPAGGGFGAAPKKPGGGFGAAPKKPSGGFGAAPKKPGGGFGAPKAPGSAAPADAAVDESASAATETPAKTGFGAAKKPGGGFGAPNKPGGFGAPKAPGSGGAAAAQPAPEAAESASAPAAPTKAGFGAPKKPGGFGAPKAPGSGAATSAAAPAEAPAQPDAPRDESSATPAAAPATPTKVGFGAPKKPGGFGSPKAPGAAAPQAATAAAPATSGAPQAAESPEPQAQEEKTPEDVTAADGSTAAPAAAQRPAKVGFGSPRKPGGFGAPKAPGAGAPAASAAPQPTPDAETVTSEPTGAVPDAAAPADAASDASETTGGATDSATETASAATVHGSAADASEDVSETATETAATDAGAGKSAPAAGFAGTRKTGAGFGKPRRPGQ